MWPDIMNTNETIQHWPEHFQSQLDGPLFLSFKRKCERTGSMMDVTQTRRPVSMKMYQNHAGFMVFMEVTGECDLLSCDTV
jgi:hypothetical protein